MPAETIAEDVAELNYYLNELREVKDRLFSSMMLKHGKLSESQIMKSQEHFNQGSIREIM